jgi:shikimate dehydrogenase
MKLFGIIGKSLSHSFSPNYFIKKFQALSLVNYEYKAFELNDIGLFNDLCKKHQDLVGLNVTIPFKETVIEFIDELADDALIIKSVNTIMFSGNKKIGFNTDIIGFEKLITPKLKSHHTSALILGTGGASKAVAHVLKKLKINFQFVSSRKKNNALIYSDINEYIVKSNTIIINTTPLGMYPNLNAFPDLPYSLLSDNHLVIDLIYNPEETLFLQKSKQMGAIILNGYQMLIEQADASWVIWNTE